ncbi:MAG TPA: type II secretion system protein [Planctomycetota bacterium]|jgi:prepilin-type N-terminal cleavage/methylation domain-containing protein|nr:type II secretion system protein [Planctomycetota bacterium]OQC22326.1 MAG: hypothetical protein BWX69_00178 [Planctomycetes bacterium ADurb.Bin069]NMD34625.1 type II secretion system protein [Planctomycetota bacterium]HNR98791.1 type II secretion system protein [Planctomycetota bacterium]HNU26717.1 type II secretion system protein [Planctomycetota bacterium]
MTISATGDRGGFTLLEILVVISLMTFLVTALVALTLNLSHRAYEASTRTLLDRIDLSIDKYKDLTGFCPPDGFDAPVTTREGGLEIRSAACLYEFLGRPLQVIKQGAGGKVVVERYDSPVMRGLKESELVRVPGDSADVAEITDAWGGPLHYDRLEGDDSYSPQNTPDVHLVPPEYHGPDPRDVPGVAVAEAGTGQNPGRYDVWSHGRHGHEAPEREEDAAALLRETIGNWQPPGKKGP